MENIGRTPEFVPLQEQKTATKRKDTDSVFEISPMDSSPRKSKNAKYYDDYDVEHDEEDEEELEVDVSLLLKF